MATTTSTTTTTKLCSFNSSPLSSLPLFFSPIPRVLTVRIATTSLRPRSRFPTTDSRWSSPLSSLAAVMFPGNSVSSDLSACGITGIVAFSCLSFWGEIGKRRIFDQKLIKYWASFYALLAALQVIRNESSGIQGALFASLVPGLNIIRMLLLGLGVYHDEGTIKSMSRHGDRRELLKGPLYYALSITVACIFCWKTSPVAIAVICNLCAGDGMADIVGRRLGTERLPYNRNKSFAGSIGMATAGFLASVVYMYYFASFGYIEDSGGMILRLAVISIAAAVVESLPISTDIDDNLTISLTSALVGILLF